LRSGRFLIDRTASKTLGREADEFR
jgi:hypothetical protein